VQQAARMSAAAPGSQAAAASALSRGGRADAGPSQAASAIGRGRRGHAQRSQVAAALGHSWRGREPVKGGERHAAVAGSGVPAVVGWPAGGRWCGGRRHWLGFGFSP